MNTSTPPADSLRESPEITLTPGFGAPLPEGVTPEEFERRRAALVALGTDPNLARMISITACIQQTMRDRANHDISVTGAA